MVFFNDAESEEVQCLKMLNSKEFSWFSRTLKVLSVKIRNYKRVWQRKKQFRKHLFLSLFPKGQVKHSFLRMNYSRLDRNGLSCLLCLLSLRDTLLHNQLPIFSLTRYVLECQFKFTFDLNDAKLNYQQIKFKINLTHFFPEVEFENKFKLS